MKVFENILIGLFVFTGFLGLVFIFSLILAWPVKLLWNWLMPTIFALKEITFWQAWGLNLLCGFLFKSHHTTKKSD